MKFCLDSGSNNIETRDPEHSMELRDTNRCHLMFLLFASRFETGLGYLPSIIGI